MNRIAWRFGYVLPLTVLFFFGMPETAQAGWVSKCGIATVTVTGIAAANTATVTLTAIVNVTRASMFGNMGAA
jgi:hypothetical protein